MIYDEQRKDIFTVSDTYHLAHCIASDLGMGAGIAVPMNKKFGLRGKILKTGLSTKAPTCILTGRIFNLITKSKSCGKPTYQSITSSLMCMRDIIIKEDIKKIAMPKIGCGLDRLSWGMMRMIIADMFDDLDIVILVCDWK